MYIWLLEWYRSFLLLFGQYLELLILNHGIRTGKLQNKRRKSLKMNAQLISHKPIKLLHWFEAKSKIIRLLFIIKNLFWAIDLSAFKCGIRITMSENYLTLFIYVFVWRQRNFNRIQLNRFWIIMAKVSNFLNFIGFIFHPTWIWHFLYSSWKWPSFTDWTSYA